MELSVFGLVLLAAFVHAAWNFAARRVSGHIGVVWLGVCVGAAVMLPLAVVVIFFGEPGQVLSLRGGAFALATGLLHALYFVLLCKAYEQGEMSVIYPIARGSGVCFTAIGAWVLLDEEITPLGAMGIAAVFAGIFLLGFQDRRQVTLTSVRPALAVGGTVMIYSLVDKVGVNTVNPALYLWFLYVISGMLMWPLVRRLHGGEMRSVVRLYWSDAVLIGLGSSLTYLVILYAYTLGPVSYIIAVREFAVVVGAALGVVFLGERITPTRILGLVTIITGLVCIRIG